VGEGLQELQAPGPPAAPERQGTLELRELAPLDLPVPPVRQEFAVRWV